MNRQRTVGRETDKARAMPTSPHTVHDLRRQWKPHNVRHDSTLARPLRDWSPKERVDVIGTNPPFGGMEEDGIEANFPAEFRTRETADLFLVLYEKLLAQIAETRAKLKAQLMEALTR